MTVALLGLDPTTYERHPLHQTDRCWTETNCYVDVWVEVLHALGLEPAAAGAFTLSTDFEGDQWTFFKYPPEDLRALYGIEIGEMNVWRGVLEHLEEQLALGRLMTVEADSYFLPDTFGVAYGVSHVKSTIVPQLVDRDARRLGYFHNAGYFELSGDDFDGVFGLGAYRREGALPPYVELVRLERLIREPEHLLDTAGVLLRQHLRRRPADNPIVRLADRVTRDTGWLVELGLERFHEYAFGTCRQCGASAEVAAAFLTWFGRFHPEDDLAGCIAAFEEIANGAKTAQLGMARIAAGRSFDLGAVFSEMADNWDVAMQQLDERYAR